MPQTIANVIAAITATTDRTSGRPTRHHVPSGVAPSSSAASKISSGILRNAHANTSTDAGVIPMRPGAMSGRSPSVAPAARNSQKRPTSSAVPGTRNATTATATTVRAWPRGSLAIANPAHDATTIARGTAIALTMSEFTA